MVSDSTRKFIRKAIERAKSAEPYPIEFLNSLPDDISLVDGDEAQVDQRRVTATMAKITLDKYFAQHPEDSIENYIAETA